MLLFTLPFLLLCPTDTPAPEPQAAVQAVLQQMLTVPDLAQFLAPLHCQKLAFHYFTLPAYNQYYLP